VGTDGQQKMSKSLDNYIAIEDPPNDMYGKVMSIPDSLMMDYFELLTDVSNEELGEFCQQLSAQSVNPMILKKRLAKEIVGQFHSGDAASEAESDFERVVQKREVPEDIPELPISFAALENRMHTQLIPRSIDPNVYSSVDVLWASKVAKSRSEAKRLILQGAVEIDGQRVTRDTVSIKDGSIIKWGKRRWGRIVNADAEQ